MTTLTADIGGTNSRFQVLDLLKSQPRVLWRASYRNAQFASFEAVMTRCLADVPDMFRPDTACLAVAGPVFGGAVRLSNLPWTLVAGKLAAQFRLQNVQLLNDLEAAAYGIGELQEGDLRILHRGAAVVDKPAVVVGIGTGYGQAMLTREADKTRVFGTEGGHADFAPATAQADRLLEALRQSYHQVSVETVFSGKGLSRILQFIHDQTIDDDLQLSADAIVRLWQLNIPTPVKAVKLFTSMLAAQLANTALNYNAFGGIYLVGGLLNAVQSLLREQSFFETFCDKPSSSFAHLLNQIPLYLVEDIDIGLKGAGAYLRQSLSQTHTDQSDHAGFLYRHH